VRNKLFTVCYLDLDVLVNNAGATWGAPLDEYPDAAFQKVMNLNVTRIFTLTQACLPLLRANATKDIPSRVINIGSINGESVRRALALER
jgi:NAD(P)-dependent dehydrogenase (short-subunit alcohol dehydrogenase family)